MSTKGTKVIVYDDNVEKALRKLKKKITDLGLMKELQERQSYVKPSVKRKLAKSQAERRWNKVLKAQSLPKKTILTKG